MFSIIVDQGYNISERSSSPDSGLPGSDHQSLQLSVDIDLDLPALIPNQEFGANDLPITDAVAHSDDPSCILVGASPGNHHCRSKSHSKGNVSVKTSVKASHHVHTRHRSAKYDIGQADDGLKVAGVSLLGDRSTPRLRGKEK